MNFPHPVRPGLFFAIWIATCAMSGPAVALAASSIQLPYPEPDAFGLVPASTYNERGERVGDASIEISLGEDDHVMLKMRGGYDDGASIALDSELEPVIEGDTRSLRILRERSQSVDPDGRPLVILEIDHEKAEASCSQPEPGGARSVIPLPSPDRVINVPLNLLFQSMSADGRDHVSTQAFFCLGGARLMGFRGEIQEQSDRARNEGDPIREVRYGPDGKSFLSWAAKAIAPQISFWMNTEDPSEYVAHRMPLYSKGPVVYVIADGIDPKRIIEH